MRLDRWQVVGSIKGFRRLGKLWGFLMLWPVAGAVALPAEHREYCLSMWKTEDGLPQNSVTSIVQTPDGYLWLATFNGLVRFDGARFTVFDEGNTAALQSSRLVRLDVDQDGGLWIITEGGELARLREGCFRSFTARDGLPPAGASAVICGPQSRVLLLDREGGVCRLADEQWLPNPQWASLQGRGASLFTDAEGGLWVWSRQNRSLGRVVADQIEWLKRPDGVQAAEVREFARSRNGGLWLVLSNRVWHYQYQRKEWKPTAWALPESVHGLTQVLEDRRGNLWVGTYGHGLLRFGPAGVCERFVAGEGLSHNAVRALWEDREGSLWVGTDGGGLNRLKPRLVTMYDVRQGLTAEVLMSIAPDPQDADTLWLGLDGGGVNRLRSGQITPLIGEPILRTNTFVYGVLADRQGGLWIGTYDQGILRYHDGHVTRVAEGKPWAGRPLLTGLEDRAGTIWLGGGFGLWRWQDGQFTNFSIQVGWSNVVVRALAEDGSGNLYVGSYGRGLCRYGHGRWTHYSEQDGLADNHTSALYIDREDTVWIGTVNDGLSRFKNDRFINYTTREGLPANSIASIVEDDYGHLWFGSNRGLFRVRKEQLDEVAEGHRRAVMGCTYGIAEGLSTLECGGGAQPGGWKTHDGRLWFATVRGLAVVDPGKLPSNPRPPPVVIEEVVLDDQVVDGQKSEARAQKSADSRTGAAAGSASPLAPRPSPLVTVPPRTGRVEFRFTGLSLIAPEKVRFRYRLDPFDDDWIEAGPRRTAYYTRVPPGEYRFHVTACNNDGVWNGAGATLNVIVQLAWWQTWWFHAGAFTGAAGLLGWTLEARLRRARRERAAQQSFARRLLGSQEDERKRIAGELHDSLGQDLLVIKNRALLGLRDPAVTTQAADQLGEISRLASHTLEEIREISRNLRPYQLDRLGLTKALQAKVTEVSRVSGVPISTQIDPIDRLLALPLEIHFYRIVQELLNNLVKHSHAATARLTVQHRAPKIILTLEDDGRGFDTTLLDQTTTRPGLGLTDIAERIRLLDGTARCNSRPAAGTRWVIEIPAPAKQSS